MDHRSAQSVSGSIPLGSSAGVCVPRSRPSTAGSRARTAPATQSWTPPRGTRSAIAAATTAAKDSMSRRVYRWRAVRCVPDGIVRGVRSRLGWGPGRRMDVTRHQCRPPPGARIAASAPLSDGHPATGGTTSVSVAVGDSRRSESRSPGHRRRRLDTSRSGPRGAHRVRRSPRRAAAKSGAVRHLPVRDVARSRAQRGLRQLGCRRIHGRPTAFLQDGRPLGHGYYPARGAIAVPITGLGRPGIYYVGLGATVGEVARPPPSSGSITPALDEPGASVRRGGPAGHERAPASRPAPPGSAGDQQRSPSRQAGVR